jgi:hypothetical protein
VAGRKVQVTANGYCWLASVLAGFGVLEEPLTLSTQDKLVLNTIVRDMQEFFEAESKINRKWIKAFDQDMCMALKQLPPIRRGASAAEIRSRCEKRPIRIHTWPCN